MTDEAAAEKIIRAWINAKCSPSPDRPEEIMRRVTGKVGLAFTALANTLNATWPSLPSNTDEEWELTR